MESLVGLTRGPERKECTGVLIVYDCWKQLVVTSYPCAPRPRVLQPEEDDGCISLYIQPSYFNGHTHISIRTANVCISIKHFLDYGWISS